MPALGVEGVFDVQEKTCSVPKSTGLNGFLAKTRVLLRIETTKLGQAFFVLEGQGRQAVLGFKFLSQERWMELLVILSIHRRSVFPEPACKRRSLEAWRGHWYASFSPASSSRVAFWPSASMQPGQARVGLQQAHFTARLGRASGSRARGKNNPII